ADGAPTSKLRSIVSDRAGSWAAEAVRGSTRSRRVGSSSVSRSRSEERGARLARGARVMRLFRTLFRAMAAEHELQLWCDDETRAALAAETAIADVARIEAKYSRYRDDSVVTRINRAAGGDPVAIDSETAALFAYADRCHRLSGGRFDITSGVLRR